MIPRTLLYLLQFAFASAFSGIAARATTTRERNNFVQVRVVLNCCSSGSNSANSSSTGFHEAGHLHKSSHIISIKSSNIAGMINDGDDKCIEVDFGSDACLVAVTGER